MCENFPLVQVHFFRNSIKMRLYSLSFFKKNKITNRVSTGHNDKLDTMIQKFPEE